MKFAFPDDKDFPAKRSELSIVPKISLTIRRQFLNPETFSSLRSSILHASRVAMPETAMHLDHAAEPAKDDVWSSRKIPIMKPVSITHPVDEPSNHHLRPSMLALDERHACASLEGTKRVHGLEKKGMKAPRIRARKTGIPSSPLSTPPSITRAKKGVAATGVDTSPSP